MTDDIIQDAISEALPSQEVASEAPNEAEASADNQGAQDVPKDDAQETEQEVAADDSTPNEGEAQESKPDDGGVVEFPKKAVNAISYRDKKINKLQAELQELRNMVQAPAKQEEKESVTQKAGEPPKEEDYDSFDEFFEATMMHKVDQRLANRDKQAQQTQATQQEQQWIAQRQQSLVSEIKENASKINDFAQVWQENAMLLDDLPKPIEMAFYQADNAPIAIYALAKEGALENLATMNPVQAAIEIGKAQIRGERYVNPPKQVSSAPAPIKGVSGKASSSKSPSTMTANELLKWSGYK
jgi:hypothetical protein